MSEPVTLFSAELPSPIGPLALVASPLGLCAVGFADLYVRLCSMGVWSDFRIL